MADLAEKGEAFRRSPGFEKIEGLTAKRTLFAIFYGPREGLPGAKADAAAFAGYSPGDRNAQSTRATELLALPKMQTALEESVPSRRAYAGRLGLNVVIQIAEEESDAIIRKGAAIELMDRAWGKPISKAAIAVAEGSVGIFDDIAKAVLPHKFANTTPVPETVPLDNGAVVEHSETPVESTQQMRMAKHADAYAEGEPLDA